MTHVHRRWIYNGSTGDLQNKNEKRLAILDDTRAYQHCDIHEYDGTLRKIIRTLLSCHRRVCINLEQTPPYRVDIKYIRVVVYVTCKRIVIAREMDILNLDDPVARLCHLTWYLTQPSWPFWDHHNVQRVHHVSVKVSKPVPDNYNKCT